MTDSIESRSPTEMTRSTIYLLLLLLGLALAATVSVRNRSRVSASYPDLGPIPGATIDTQHLFALPNASDVALSSAPLIAVFSSQSSVCAECLNEVHEYLLILGELRSPNNTAVFLLIDADRRRARHFAHSRQLDLPVLFEPDRDLLDALYNPHYLASFNGRIVGDVTSMPPPAFRPPTVSFVDAQSGGVLFQKTITTTMSSPDQKRAAISALPALHAASTR